MKILAVACFLIVAVEGKRDPRLFFISTSISTSTLTTSSFCYTSSATLTSCLTTGKKRRSILETPNELVDFDAVLPSIRRSRELEIDSGLDNETKAGKREGKFLLYWMTTTTTSTSTTYTLTASLSALECTPSSWTYSVCGLIASGSCQNREPKLFLISSTTTTSTLSTFSICYETAASSTACLTLGKKKRSVIYDSPVLDFDIALPSPRQDRELDLSSSQDGVSMKAKREGKFLVYWMTTTSTSTTTTYTATASLSQLNCTPTSWTLALCG